VSFIMVLRLSLILSMAGLLFTQELNPHIFDVRGLSNVSQSINKTDDVVNGVISTTTVINPITSVAAAFGAAFLTNHFTLKRETNKEKQFNKSIRMLVRNELNTYYKFIDDLIIKASNKTVSGDWNKYISRKYVENVPHNYTQLSAETKAKVFGNFEDLKNVESAYLDFQSFVDGLLSPRRLSTEEGKIGFKESHAEKVKLSISTALKFSD
jgi:hypothetical protein